MESQFSQHHWQELMKLVVNNPKLEWFNETRIIITDSKTLEPEQKRELYDQLYTHWENKAKELINSGYDAYGYDSKVQPMFSDYTHDSLRNMLEVCPPTERSTFAARILRNMRPSQFSEAFKSSLDSTSGIITNILV